MPQDELVILRSLKRARAVLRVDQSRDDKSLLDKLHAILDSRRLHAAVDRRMRACGLLYRQALIEPRTVTVIPENDNRESAIVLPGSHSTRWPKVH
jgi:hypothetical protein